MSNQVIPRNMRWKVYLWLMALLFVVALGFEIAEPADAPLIDAIDYLSWGFSLIGVFGYAYSRAVINQRIWRIWLPILVVWGSSHFRSSVVHGP